MQNSFFLFGIGTGSGLYDLAGLLSIAFILIASVGIAISAPKKQKGTKKGRPMPKSGVPKGLTWQERLQKGMTKSREKFWDKITALMGQGPCHEAIEEILYSADLGPATAQSIMEKLQNYKGKASYDIADLKKIIKESLVAKMIPIQENFPGSCMELSPGSFQQTKVIMAVGINGAGKTTTIGKLAVKLKKQGAKVVVGACDTFRAAAMAQLQIWCERANCEMVKTRDGGDPAGAAYSALQRAISVKADYCLIDTAGRAHTKKNLMLELEKTKRALGKLIPHAPDEVILVLDAVTGQNALRQASEFNRILNLNSLILTKCDGPSKAGPAVAIMEKLQIPISYIGVGEEAWDLGRFDVAQYVDAMIN